MGEPAGGPIAVEAGVVVDFDLAIFAGLVLEGGEYFLVEIGARQGVSGGDGAGGVADGVAVAGGFHLVGVEDDGGVPGVEDGTHYALHVG